MESKENASQPAEEIKINWLAKNRMSCIIEKKSKWYDTDKMRDFMFFRDPANCSYTSMDKSFAGVTLKMMETIGKDFPNSNSTLEEQIIFQMVYSEFQCYVKAMKILELHENKKMLPSFEHLKILKTYILVCPYVIVDILLNEGRVDERSYEHVRKDLLNYFTLDESKDNSLERITLQMINSSNIALRSQSDITKDKIFIDASKELPLLKDQNFNRDAWLKYTDQVKNIIAAQKELTADEYLIKYIDIYRERLLSKLLTKLAFEEIYGVQTFPFTSIAGDRSFYQASFNDLIYGTSRRKFFEQ